MKNLITITLLLLASAFSATAQQVQLITGNEERAQFESKSYLITGGLTLKPGFTASGQNGAWYARVHPEARPATVPSPDQNFVRTENVLVSGISTEEQVRSLSAPAKAVAYQYTDGLGRPLQSTAVAASPAGKDVVQPAYYDAQGRPARSYLPYTAGTANGSFKTNALGEQGAFYASPPATVPADSRPFSEITFDSSPMNRPLQTTATGSAWSAKPVNSKFGIDNGSIPLWQIASDGTMYAHNYYPPGSLTFNEVTNEAGTSTRTFTDFIGQTIVTETQLTTDDWARTYYVHSKTGNLLFVIPPAALALLIDPFMEKPFMDQWLYQYQYDDYHRQTGTKAPGAEWVYTIYDQWDRPVLTQDGNQRAKSPAEWSFVKYDDLNRAIASGIYATTESRATLTTQAAAATGRYEQRNTSAAGYTLNQSFPAVAEANLLSITYYDDYGYLTNASWDAQGKSFAFVAEPGFTGAAFTTVKDLATGGKTRIVGTGTDIWLNSVTYYDNRYRPLQTISDNPFEKPDRLTSEYDFTGQVLKTKHVHTQPNSQSVTVQERYAYDPAGRLLHTWHQVNSQPEVLLSSLEYNELSQVVKKKLHVQPSAPLQAIDYRYNIRGWLTQVNFTGSTGDPVDYFNMELAYNTSQGTGNTPRYDGAITGARWKSGDETKEKAYAYTYDNRGWLSAATYNENHGTGWNANPGRYNESATYDQNGNIATLQRNGEQSSATATIDQLSYTYNGNQLASVADNAPAPGNGQGFADGNTTGSDYLYDANGNLLQDKNKNFTIAYNNQDLPERITFLADNSYLLYTYAAGGARLSASLYNSSNQVQLKTDYAGAYVYVNGSLSLLHHAEGRYLTPGGDANAGIYQYYLTDHLGNTRVVLSTQPGAGSSMMATLEDASATQEEQDFLHYDQSRRVKGKLFDHTRKNTSGTALRLSGLPGEQTGLATSLSVMPGDTVSMEVFAKYLSPEKKFDGQALVDNLASAAVVKMGSLAVDGGAASLVGKGASLPFGAVFNKSDDSNSQAPRAYLNWLFFDRNFVMKNAGYKRLSEQAKEDGTDVAHEQLAEQVVITEPGYMYVYLSNEEQQATEVYFDDFRVLVSEGPVIQINDYYPYGMVAYSWVREGEQETKEKFQGKEYESKTGLYDFHARQYDGAIGRFWAMDPANQFASGYVGMGNNPVSGIDPDGQFVFTLATLIAAPFTGGASLALLPTAIGADIGMWSGGSMANGTANPFKWDYSSGKTWAYMGAGAVVGAASGGAANAVATSGIPFANTAAIVTGSTINSLGTKIYTGGQTDFTIGFGLASYNVDQNEWGYLGKKGNSALENIGYGLGALANAGDILAGFQPSEVQLNTENSDAIGHSALTKVGETDPRNSLVSVGPDPGGKWIFNPFKFKKGTNNWKNYVNAGDDVSKVTVKGINLKRIANYGARLDKGVKYNLYCSSCVNHTARALTIAGAPSIGIHPFILNAQMYMRSIGARPSLFSHHLYGR